MNRRGFLGIAAASIFAPRFGRWYRQGSGLIVREVEAGHLTTLTCRTSGADALNFVILLAGGERVIIPATHQGSGMFSATYRAPQAVIPRQVGVNVPLPRSGRLIRYDLPRITVHP